MKQKRASMCIKMKPYRDALVEREHVLGGGLEVRGGIVRLGDEGLVLAAVVKRRKVSLTLMN
jgi:hypothetical protein